jgi:hypothetical protein
MESGAARVAARNFEPHEVALSIAGAALTLVSFFALLAFAGQSRAHVNAQQPPPPAAMPIAVRPVLDDLPLLKLGGKKVKPKLPNMWKKNPPVQRFESQSAPSPKAAKTPDKIPDSPLAKRDAEAPPPDAEIAKQVDQVLLDASPDKEANTEGEGSPDGVKEGTETDPLKARAVSQYMSKLLAWFDARFQPPVGAVECDELKKLSTSVQVSVGPDRHVTGYSVLSPSGNGPFDERAKTTMDRIVGEELPPPPPLYPDILSTTLPVRFSGKKAQCEVKPSSPVEPAPSAAPPSAPAPGPAPTPAPAPPPEPAPAPSPPSESP